MGEKVKLTNKPGDPSAITLDAAKNVPWLKERIESQFPSVKLDVSNALGRTETPVIDGVEQPVVYYPAEVEIRAPEGMDVSEVVAAIVRAKPDKTQEQEQDEAKAVEIFRLLATYQKKELRDLLK